MTGTEHCRARTLQVTQKGLLALRRGHVNNRGPQGTLVRKRLPYEAPTVRTYTEA